MADKSERVDNLVNMIDGYVEDGGHHLNVNVFNRDTLLDAQAHPEKYPQLTVRVSGYAVNFNKLTKEQQDDLEHHHKLGAVTFVLVSMGLTECYRVPWPVWRDMADTYGRKYMTRAELLPYKVPVVAGFVKFLDKLPPESITVKDLSPEELERLKKMIREQPATIIVGEVKP